MNCIDLIEMKKWKSIPENNQQRILTNVFCSNRKNTTLVNYTFGIRFSNLKLCIKVLKGKEACDTIKADDNISTGRG